MATLEEDMLAQSAPQSPMQPPMRTPMQPQVAPTESPIGDVMRQGVQDATGDFITTMIEMLERKGIDLDEVMNPTVEDQFDVVEGDANPLEMLGEEELVMLVEKFNALAPEVQAELESAFIRELPPRFVQRLRAVQRMVGGRQI